MDVLQAHENGKIFLFLDPEIGAVSHITSMAILPAGALILQLKFRQLKSATKWILITDIFRVCSDHSA